MCNGLNVALVFYVVLKCRYVSSLDLGIGGLSLSPTHGTSRQWVTSDMKGPPSSHSWCLPLCRLMWCIGDCWRTRVPLQTQCLLPRLWVRILSEGLKINSFRLQGHLLEDVIGHGWAGWLCVSVTTWDSGLLGRWQSFICGYMGLIGANNSLSYWRVVLFSVIGRLLCCHAF